MYIAVRLDKAEKIIFFLNQNDEHDKIEPEVLAVLLDVKHGLGNDRELIWSNFPSLETMIYGKQNDKKRPCDLQLIQWRMQFTLH